MQQRARRKSAAAEPQGTRDAGLAKVTRVGTEVKWPRCGANCSLSISPVAAAVGPAPPGAIRLLVSLCPWMQWHCLRVTTLISSALTLFPPHSFVTSIF